MASLDLLQLSPLPDAAGSAVVALATLGLFLLTFEFLATAKRRQRSHGNCSAITTKRRALGEGRGIGRSESEGSEKLQRKMDTNGAQAPGPSAELPLPEVLRGGKYAPVKRKGGGKRNTVYWEKNFVSVPISSMFRLRRRLLGRRGVRALTRQLCRVRLIRFEKGRPPENLFRRIKQKDISLVELMLWGVSGNIQGCVSLPYHWQMSVVPLR